MTMVGFALLITMMSIVLLIFSLISFIGYIGGNGVGLPFETSACTFPLIIFMLVSAGIVVMLVSGLLNVLDKPKHLRAAYFLMLFPIVLGSFVLSSLMDGTVPSMIFGWPLFLMGAVLFPYCAFALRGGIGAHADGGRALIVCYNCGSTLVLREGAAQDICPRCGSLNLYPFMGMPPKPPPPGSETQWWQGPA
jgi:hypothetical protein